MKKFLFLFLLPSTMFSQTVNPTKEDSSSRIVKPTRVIMIHNDEDRAIFLSEEDFREMNALKRRRKKKHN